MNESLLATATGEIKRLGRKGKVVMLDAKSAMTYVALPLALVTLSSASHAITAPAAGTFAYDLYDVAVNDMIKGAPGFVGGMITVIVSAINITKNWLLAGGGILGGTALIKADSITTSLGALV